MALITTNAIVLNTIKYGDSSLIVKCYTKELGLLSFLVRGVLKAKKKGAKIAYFQVLNQLSISFNYKNKNALSSIKDIRVVNPYKTIPNSIVKQSLVLFLSEMLSKSIQEETADSNFYAYLESALVWLDYHDKVSNFHLLFLLNLTRFLGFYPDMSNSHYSGFDLQEGNFTQSISNKFVIKNNDFYQFKKLLGINFDDVEEVNFSKKERQTVLQIIIQYFQLHLGNFSKPKSLQVLETIFN